jgi:isocitrate dehydrogenase
MNPSTLTNPNSIQVVNGTLIVPNFPIIPFIPGDGIGPQIWAATREVVDLAVQTAYEGTRAIKWLQVYAGEKAFRKNGEWLPLETVDAFNQYKVGIKGPLTTPVGGGIRSLNVALRKDLDLYVCLRPVCYFEGIKSPVREPEKVNITVFRENTEDLYTGIEFSAGSADALKFLDILNREFPEMAGNLRFMEDLGIGIKPISKAGTERLVRAAMNYAIKNNKHTLTLVHKGNIMKFTEGAFRTWGYDLVEREFGDSVFTERNWLAIQIAKGEEIANQAKEKALELGKILVNDVITDNAFQKILLEPESFSVIATTNLNGDYLSDALAAQIGGIGIAPGANINFESGLAIFEATHGTSPTQAGKNLANPSSLILSAELMLRYLGWHEAADSLYKALGDTIKAGELTVDLAITVDDSKSLGTLEFGQAICKRIAKI